MLRYVTFIYLNLEMQNHKVGQTRAIEATRIDSLQNKEILLVTARKLFKDKGLEVPLIEIAKAAGVTRMTFYRHFPNRNAIIDAVFDQNLERLAVFTQKIENSENCFFKLLNIVLRQRVEYNLYLPYVSEAKGKIHVERLIKIFAEPIKKAKQSGMLRNDFDGHKDLLLLILMMGGAVGYSNVPGGNPTTKRVMNFIIEGIKP